MRRIYSGTLPGFPQHLRIAQVQQELPIIDDTNDDNNDNIVITPISYILNNNTSRNMILKQIEFIENQEIDGINSLYIICIYIHIIIYINI